MDPSNRITKDISARKNTTSSDTHSAIEAAARLASREAYTNSLIQGYQDKIATMEAEQQAAVDEVVREARAESAKQWMEMQETIEEQKRTLATKDSEIKRLTDRLSTLRFTWKNEVKTLKEQLTVGPNSWMEIHVKGRGFRLNRSYVRRPTAPFTEALTELALAQKKDLGHMKFRHEGVVIRGDESRTLEQLGIKDGAVLEIVYDESWRKRI